MYMYYVYTMTYVDNGFLSDWRKTMASCTMKADNGASDVCCLFQSPGKFQLSRNFVSVLM